MGRLTLKSLLKMEEIIDKRLDEEDPNYLKLMAQQQAAAATMISTQVKVADSVLRTKEIDTIEKLLVSIKEKKAAREELKKSEEYMIDVTYTESLPSFEPSSIQ